MCGTDVLTDYVPMVSGSRGEQLLERMLLPLEQSLFNEASFRSELGSITYSHILSG
jgi:hypothetical protein